MRSITGFIAAAFIVSLFAAAAVFGQSVPRASQRQEITQTVGDTTIAIVYHRPNVKGRKIWGGLVPYGEVWRAGANENTTIEFSRDVFINGKPLPAGKYGFHTIPTAGKWTLIFSKANSDWGSFSYDEKKDALRVEVTPVALGHSHESLAYIFNNVAADSVEVDLVWEKLSVPFTVGIGDINARTVEGLRKAIAERKEGDTRPLLTAANFVTSNKMTADYDDAEKWFDEASASGETFNTASGKARLYFAKGDKAKAVEFGEKALKLAAEAERPPNAEMLDAFKSTVEEWKASK